MIRTQRDLDIGFECGRTWAYQRTITHSLLERIAKLGCTLTVTLYPMERSGGGRDSAS